MPLGPIDKWLDKENSWGYPFQQIVHAETILFGPFGEWALGPNYVSRWRLTDNEIAERLRDIEGR